MLNAHNDDFIKFSTFTFIQKKKIRRPSDNENLIRHIKRRECTMYNVEMGPVNSYENIWSRNKRR